MYSAARSDGERAGRFAPGESARERVLERAGRVDLATKIIGALAVVLFIWTALSGEVWALLPLVVIALVLTLGPVWVNRSDRPGRAEFVIELCMTSAVATGAALTGAVTSPLTYLMLVSVVVGAMRAVPRTVVIRALAAGIIFLGASMLSDAQAVIDDPLPMVAILSALAMITLAATTLAGAESDTEQTRSSIPSPACSTARHWSPASRS